MMARQARDRICRKIAAAANTVSRDFYLDQLTDLTLRATEWDAEQWGLFVDGRPGELADLADAFDAFWSGRGDSTRWPVERVA